MKFYDIEQVKERFMKKVELIPFHTCWEWNGSFYNAIKYNGRPRFSVRHEWRLAARVSYEIFKGPIKSGLNVCHSCDNPNCVNPSHLWLGTQMENVQDMIKKGRQAMGDKVANKGEKNPAAKITAIQAEEIRQRYSQNNISQDALGKMYGISQVMVGLIVRGKKWNHS